jgi:hypothetical protein
MSIFAEMFRFYRRLPRFALDSVTMETTLRKTLHCIQQLRLRTYETLARQSKLCTMEHSVDAATKKVA